MNETREEYNARKRRERAKHPGRAAAQMRLLRQQESPEKRAIRLEKARVQQAEWRRCNPDHEGNKQAKKKWKLANSGKVNAATVKRRIAKLNRTPTWLTEEDYWMITQAYELAQLRTKLFGFSWHVDHIIPLQGKSISGLHVPINLQVIPGVENVAKANRHIVP